MDVLRMVAHGFLAIAAGWTAALGWYLPAYREECREHRDDVRAERLRRAEVEGALWRADDLLRRYAVELDDLRRRLIAQGDVLGSLPAGPTAVDARDLIPPQGLPVPGGRP